MKLLMTQREIDREIAGARGETQDGTDYMKITRKPDGSYYATLDFRHHDRDVAIEIIRQEK